jgi:hypothetical protein
MSAEKPDSEVLDFRDLTRAALERMLKNALMKKGGEFEAKKKAAQEDEDKEREDLADLSDEKGKSNAPDVEEDDFDPSAVKATKGDDKPKKDDKPLNFKKKVGGKKAPPFGKKKGGGFPFAKKGK